MAKAKIVLLNIESDTELQRRKFSPPFGILVAASVLKKYDIDVTIKHLLADNSWRSILKDECEDALAVGFSTMTSLNLLPTIQATRYLKSLGHFTFWGGIHATLLPELSLTEESLDAVLRGEAEANLYNFVLWRLGRIRHSEVEGLCFKNTDGSYTISEIPAPVESTKLAHHSFDLLEVTKYLDKNHTALSKKNCIDRRMIPYMTSKGCNRRCTFCYNSAINKCLWRGYNIENVYHEMDWLIEKHNVEGWLFYDDDFFSNTSRAWSIIERYKMPSFIELHLTKINHKLLERAKESNIERLFVGIESGSNTTLSRIKKGINTKLIREKVEMCLDINMNLELSFMILFPNETVEELKSTFDLIDELGTYHNVSIAGPKIYNPYPGTFMYDELCKSGWQEPKTNEEWSKYERNVSPEDTGFNLSEAHLELLESRGII